MTNPQRGSEQDMSTFRRVPYAPEPEAPYYHDALATATMKSNDEATRIGFAWWFVDNCAGRMTPAEAWKSAEWTAILNSKSTT
jgi:hypothetical protein